MLSVLCGHMIVQAGARTAALSEATSIIRRASSSHAVKKSGATACITDEPALNLMMPLRYVKAQSSLRCSLDFPTALARACLLSSRGVELSGYAANAKCL